MLIKSRRVYVGDRFIPCVIEIEKEISLSVVGKTTMRVETKAENETWDELENLTVDENFIK